jgi:hypothetical protein
MASGSNLDETRRLAGEALALYEEAGEVHAAARATSALAVAEHLSGNGAAAIERLERTYAVVADDEPDEDLALLFVRLGQAHWFAGDTERAAEMIERALDVGEALRLPEILVRGWSQRAMLLSATRPEEARGLYQMALDAALEHELYSQASATLGNLSDLAFQHDRYGESLSRLEEELALARRVGNRRNELFALSEMSYVLTMLGRWDEACAAMAEIPEDHLGHDTNLLSPLSGVLEIHLHRGELEQARRLLALFQPLARTAEVQIRGVLGAARAALQLAEGNPRGALAEAEEAFAGRATLGLGSQDVKLGFVHALEAAVALGDRRRADELVTIVEEGPIGLRPPFLAAQTRRFRALLVGGDPAADTHFTAAAAQLRALDLPFHLAVVRLEHGEWLRAQARPDDAEPFLAEARETFMRLGAGPWLARAEGALPAGREPEPVGA